MHKILSSDILSDLLFFNSFASNNIKILKLLIVLQAILLILKFSNYIITLQQNYLDI